MHDVLTIWTAASEHYHALWVLYVAVAFGVLGFRFTDSLTPMHMRPRGPKGS